MRLRPQTALQIAGLTACTLAAVQGGLDLAYGPDLGVGMEPRAAAAARALAWGFLAACYGGFAATFWWTIRRRPEEPPTWRVVSLLALQAVLGLFVAAELLYIVAAEVPFVLRARTAVAWIAVQGALSVAWGILSWVNGDFVAVEGLGHLPEPLRNGLTLLWVLVWQGLACATGWIAASESRGRGELARLNAELLATRELLADSSRLAERLHIARELHDSLGHHLAALAVNLDLANRTAAGPAAEPVREAHTLARLLLGEVREVVSELRESRPLDLPRALRTLLGGAGGLDIHLEAPAGLEIRDPAQAHALFRCAQEAITNALKHARARHLWIELACEGSGIVLRARDDGRGAAEVVPGHGLRGMRERLAELGGRLEVETRPGDGFTLRAWMPAPEGAP
jgi:signal transduction histidine kinase